MFLAGTMETGQRIDTLTVPFLAIRETVLNRLLCKGLHKRCYVKSDIMSSVRFAA